MMLLNFMTQAFVFQDGVKPLFRGWMEKQGGFLQSWNNRAFILNREGLYYFKNEPRSGVFN